MSDLLSWLWIRFPRSITLMPWQANRKLPQQTQFRTPLFLAWHRVLLKGVVNLLRAEEEAEQAPNSKCCVHTAKRQIIQLKTVISSLVFLLATAPRNRPQPQPWTSQMITPLLHRNQQYTMCLLALITMCNFLERIITTWWHCCTLRRRTLLHLPKHITAMIRLTMWSQLYLKQVIFSAQNFYGFWTQDLLTMCAPTFHIFHPSKTSNLFLSSFLTDPLSWLSIQPSLINCFLLMFYIYLSSIIIWYLLVN